MEREIEGKEGDREKTRSFEKQKRTIEQKVRLKLEIEKVFWNKKEKMQRINVSGISDPKIS